MKLTLNFLPSTEALLNEHEQAGQQPDNLCGPYWVSLLLQAYGRLPVSAVEVAKAASTILPNQGNPSDWLPPGAMQRQAEGYNTIPTVANIDECGTSVDGLIQATKSLSQGRFCLLPLQTENWELGLDILSQVCHECSDSEPDSEPNLGPNLGPDLELDSVMVPLLNIHTSYFGGSRLTPSKVVQFLQTGEAPSTSPDWAVGHFALLMGHLQKQSQSQAQKLYAILDTYPQFGWNGLHLQPSPAIAQSLRRPQHSTQGGILLFTPSKNSAQVQKVLVQQGFQIAAWDNGTPFCPP